ncbi:MAG: hypothetical protein LBO77_05780 [Desulfovibrio sp.]|jgi:hypothetical protein|nr:hypothetical protein [Desulfovibrio sp.]
MIIDNLCVFSNPDTAIANGAASASVPLGPYTGKGPNPVNVTVIVTTAFTPAGATVTAILQQSEDNAAFADVASFALPDPTQAGAMLTFALPYNFKGKYARLKYTVTGTSATGNLFAAVTRDHFGPYEAGQYIRDGKAAA